MLFTQRHSVHTYIGLYVCREGDLITYPCKQGSINAYSRLPLVTNFLLLISPSIPVGCWWLQSAVSWLQHGILVCIGLKEYDCMH